MKTTQEFLNTLFPDLGNGFIEVRKIHSVDHDVQSNFYESHDQLSRELFSLESLAKECNVYFGVCPRSRKEGTKDAVKFVWCLWIDLDAKSFDGGKIEALARLREFPLLPTAIADSGNGYHVYWRLKEAEEIGSPADIVKVETYLKGLATSLNGDRQAAELARILRIPGTQNLKNPAAPLTVALIECEADRQYNLSDFDAYLPLISPVQKAPKSSSWIAEALTALTEGNRNATFTKIAGRLNKDGLDSEEIVALLSAHAEISCFPLKELRQLIEGICRRYPSKRSSPSSPYREGKLEADSKPMEVISMAQLLLHKPEATDWLVDRILPRDGVAILAGPAGYGKSWMLLDLAIECCRGGNWLGHFPTKKAQVIYIDEESSHSLLQRRLGKLVEGKMKSDDPVDLNFVIGQGLSFSNTQSTDRLQKLLTTRKPDLVIIDSLIRVHQAEENSATEMSQVFAVIKGLTRDHRCAFLFADHQRKPGIHGGGSMDSMLRGSTEKVAFVDTLLSLRKYDDSLIVEHSKSRYDEAVAAFVIKIEDKTPGTTTVTYAGSAETIKTKARQEEASAFLRSALPGDEWVSRKKLVEQIQEAEISEKLLDQTLKALETEKRIEREDRKPDNGPGGKAAYYRWRLNSSPPPDSETETETK